MSAQQHLSQALSWHGASDGAQPDQGFDVEFSSHLCVVASVVVLLFRAALAWKEHVEGDVESEHLPKLTCLPPIADLQPAPESRVHGAETDLPNFCPKLLQFSKSASTKLSVDNACWCRSTQKVWAVACKSLWSIGLGLCTTPASNSTGECLVLSGSVGQHR